MEENLHNDQLERFFRKELGELEDTPQTDFWDELADKIPPKPKKKRGFIIPFWQYGIAASIAGILVFSVWQWFNYNNEMNQMANTIEKQNQNIENLTNKIDGLESISDNTPTNKGLTTTENENKLPTNEIDTNENQLIANKNTKTDKPTLTNKQHQPIKEQETNLALNEGSVSNNDNKFSSKNGGNTNKPPSQKFNKVAPTKNKLDENQQLAANTNNETIELEGFEKIDRIEPTLIAQNDLPLNLIPIRGLLNPVPLETQPSYLDENLLDIVALTTSTEVFKKPGTSKGFFTGLRFAPTIAHRVVRHPDKVIKRKIDEKEKIGFDYSLGLEVGYSFNENWSIISGVGYTVENQFLRHKKPLSVNYSQTQGLSTLSSYGDITIGAELPLENTNGIPPNHLDFDADLKGNIKVEFVNIPLLAEYRFGWKKFRIALKTGFALESIARISVNIKQLEDKNEGNQQLAFSKDEPHQINEPPKNVHFNWIVGAGLYYAVNNKLNIYIEPYAKGGLTPAFKGKETKTYPYSFALNTGFRWYL